PYLKYQLYRSGLSVELSFGGYDTFWQEVISKDFSKIKQDIIVTSLLLEQIEPDYELSNWSVDLLAERLFELWNLILSKSEGILAINTFLRPFYSDMGFAGETNEASLVSKISQLNEEIKNFAKNQSSEIFVIDWERLIMRLGMEASIDRRFGYISKAPFKPAFLKLYAEEIAKIGRAKRGKIKKVLVLDCDNALWGGIVGEDGISGIKLDCNEYPGKAFYDFQKGVLQLFNRGVIIVL
ncbi:unnamed protein product, partial [marine sediment metagenome]